MDVDALIAALEPYRGKKAFVFTDNDFGDHYLVEQVAEITNGDNKGCPIIYFSEDNPFIFAEKRIKEITNKADAELRVIRDRVAVLKKDNSRLKEEEIQKLLSQGEKIVKESKEAIDLEHQRAKRLT